MIEKFETISGSVDLTRVYPSRNGYVRGRTFSTGIQLSNAIDENGDVIEDSTQFTLLSQVDTGTLSEKKNFLCAAANFLCNEISYY